MPGIPKIPLTLTPAFAQSNPELLKLFNEDRKGRANWHSMTPAALDAMVKNDAVHPAAIGGRRGASHELRAVKG
jgi:hypothetical protein